MTQPLRGMPLTPHGVVSPVSFAFEDLVPASQVWWHMVVAPRNGLALVTLAWTRPGSPALRVLFTRTAGDVSLQPCRACRSMTPAFDPETAGYVVAWEPVLIAHVQAGQEYRLWLGNFDRDDQSFRLELVFQ
jgi:hypothetical protein